MKVWYFLQWQWQQFDAWQKMWMVAFFFFGAGIGAEKGSTHETVFYTMSVTIFICLFLKWMLWDSIRDQWIRFNKEQEHLIKIMKDTK